MQDPKDSKIKINPSQSPSSFISPNSSAIGEIPGTGITINPSQKRSHMYESDYRPVFPLRNMNIGSSDKSNRNGKGKEEEGFMGGNE